MAMPSYSPAKAFEEGYTQIIERAGDSLKTEDLLYPGQQTVKRQPSQQEQVHGWGERIKLLEAKVNLLEAEVQRLHRAIVSLLPSD